MKFIATIETMCIYTYEIDATDRMDARQEAMRLHEGCEQIENTQMITDVDIERIE